MFSANKTSEKFKNGRQKNGVACTIARVIQIKNVFSRRVAAHVRTVILLLMVKIAKNLKSMLKTAQQWTASRAAVTEKLQRNLMKGSRIFTATWYRVQFCLLLSTALPSSRQVSNAGGLRLFKAFHGVGSRMLEYTEINPLMEIKAAGHNTLFGTSQGIQLVLVRETQAVCRTIKLPIALLPGLGINPFSTA